MIQGLNPTLGRLSHLREGTMMVANARTWMLLR